MSFNRQKPLEIFNYAMIALYFIIGVLLIFMPGAFGGMQGWVQITFGVLLMLYGVFRTYIVYQNKKYIRDIKGKDPLLVLLFVIQLVSCKTNPYQSGAYSDRDTVLVSIDETVRPVLQSGFEVFMSTDTLSDMFIEYVPEHKAISNLIDGKATIAVASRPLTKTEKDLMAQRTIYPRTTKIAVDAIAVITNQENPDSILTVDDVIKILTGEYSNWKQVNRQQKDKSIKVIFDNQESGIVRYMADTICKGARLAQQVYGMDLNTDVVEYVSTNKDAIGFIGVSWISDPDDSLHLSFLNKIKVMAISVSDTRSYDDSYKPYQAYMFDGMYPFIRDIYIINAEPKDGKGTRFANFMAGHRGQRLILKSGILPANAPTRLIHINESL